MRSIASQIQVQVLVLLAPLRFITQQDELATCGGDREVVRRGRQPNPSPVSAPLRLCGNSNPGRAARS